MKSTYGYTTAGALALVICGIGLGFSGRASGQPQAVKRQNQADISSAQRTAQNHMIDNLVIREGQIRGDLTALRNVVAGQAREILLLQRTLKEDEGRISRLEAASKKR